eukprot:TRINITY_DN19128_c0_g4_i1.p2 TRINITY_DN19128_c0_g4~~TRINITY_DN19128_c0_g4_i1.p2  ORF type:complete len:285 (+),score=83.19 TRINITY_DN19128_c0_g4_i1:331-1185(+)
MGCGSSTQRAKSAAPVLATEEDEGQKADVKAPQNLVDVPLIETDSVEILSEGMSVVICRKDDKVICKVDSEIRNDDVRKMFYDSYWSFLRFPDTGRGGRVQRDRHLPSILGKVKGVVQGTACKAWIPDQIQLDLDIPNQLQRGQIVRAIDDVHVGEGTLAVMRGTNGTVVGVILPANPTPNVVGSDMKRVNVRWDRREDGKTKKISVLDDECRLTSDLPGSLLRGSKVLRLEDKDVVTPFAGVVVGHPQEVKGAPAVRVYWDDKGVEEDVLAADLHVVTVNTKK